MSAETPIIAAQRLERVYELGESRVVGLGGVHFEVNRGELVVIKGVSGSGKSTLLSLLAGLDRPSGGKLTVAGRDLGQCPESALTRYRREVVGMIFQSFNLLPTLSVQENVGLPALLAKRSPVKIMEKARSLLDWLGMTHRMDHRPHQLSGGEMQRTAIARALINDPEIILADEPTGNLDSQNGRAVIELLGDLNRSNGRTVLIATHSDQADAWASRTLCLKDGVLLTKPCAA